jgi:putative endonuclease
MSWSVYIIRCSDSSLYTGVTTDVPRRISEHNSKKGAFYTRNKTPVKLVYQEPMANQSEACKRESAIKRLPRIEKLNLIKTLKLWNKN